MSSIRLLPMVILTGLMLLTLKGFSLLTGDYSSLGGVTAVLAQEDMSADDAMTADDGLDAADMASEVDADAEIADAADTEAAQSDDGAQPLIGDEPIEENAVLPIESSRDLLLERLGERRQRIEEREQDLRVREQLLEAAERRLEERLAELTALEARVTSAVQSEEERQSEEIGRLVQVYSAMRAKDAAAIFDLLDLPILVEVAQAMNPRKMADILGNMEPEAARRLTIALAGTPLDPLAMSGDANTELPLIEGVPVQ